jgi:hypothetical protein
VDISQVPNSKSKAKLNLSIHRMMQGQIKLDDQPARLLLILLVVLATHRLSSPRPGNPLRQTLRDVHRATFDSNSTSGDSSHITIFDGEFQREVIK